MALYYPLLKIVPSEYNTQNPLIGFSNLFASIFLRKNFDVNHINNIGIDLSTSIKWDGNIISHSQISSMGNIMYTSHSIWLIVVSVILLLAMVGSIIVTLDTKKNTTLKGAVISNS